MADENRLPFAVDSALGRLVARSVNITHLRPSAPRGFKAQRPGWFTWVSPQEQNFTHYRLRIDHDDGLPDYQLSAGHTSIQLFRGGVFFLSTYNDNNRLESPRVLVVYDAEADLGVIPGSSPSEEVVVTAEYTLTSGSFPIPCTPAPASGLRLVVYLNQDATGGRTVAWASCFKNAPVDLDGTPSTQSVAGFVYKGGFWYFDGSFSTGLGTI